MVIWHIPYFVCACNVLCENSGTETVLSAVGTLNGLLLGLELAEHDEGTEDFLLEDRVVVLNILKQCRQNEVPTRHSGLTALDENCTLFLTLLDILHHSLILLLRHLRTVAGVFVEGVADN